MSGRFLLYLVPNLLVLIEALFRSISSTDTSTFIGPTWASVGIALILPLTRRQKMRHQPDVADEFYKQADDYGLDLVPKGENELIDLFIIVLFVAIALWVLSLYLSLKQANIIAFAVDPVGSLSQLRVPWYNVVGLGVLIVGIASTEYKERQR